MSFGQFKELCIKFFIQPCKYKNYLLTCMFGMKVTVLRVTFPSGEVWIKVWVSYVGSVTLKLQTFFFSHEISLNNAGTLQVSEWYVLPQAPWTGLYTRARRVHESSAW